LAAAGVGYVASTPQRQNPNDLSKFNCRGEGEANAFPLLTSCDVVPQASLEIRNFSILERIRTVTVRKPKGKSSFPPFKYFLRFGKISSGSKLSGV